MNPGPARRWSTVLLSMLALALALLVPAGATAARDSGGAGSGSADVLSPDALPPDADRGPVSRADGEEVDYPTVAWFMPTGKPKAVVITIHGGSWFQSEGFTEATGRFAERFARGGSAAMNIDYSTGLSSLPDVVEAYDIARAAYPKLPICVYGWSAGGNLALLLSMQRDVACVIAESPPTDIYTGSQNIKDVANYLFPDYWRRFSPALRMTRINQPTMVVSARSDELVPHTQAKEIKAKVPAIRLFALDPGDAGFIHAQVDQAQLMAVRRYELDLVTKVASKYKK